MELSGLLLVFQINFFPSLVCRCELGLAEGAEVQYDIVGQLISLELCSCDSPL